MYFFVLITEIWKLLWKINWNRYQANLKSPENVVTSFVKLILKVSPFISFLFELVNNKYGYNSK